jgi:hypothetical protein
MLLKLLFLRAAVAVYVDMIATIVTHFDVLSSQIGFISVGDDRHFGF